MDAPRTTSWVTTLIGAVGAVATTLVPLLQNGTVDLQTLVSAAALALLGWFAKDWNVVGSGSGANTGGSSGPNSSSGPFPK